MITLDLVEDVILNLNVMNIISLQSRREFHCLSLSSKILNGLINYYMKSEDSRVLNIPTTIRSVKYLNV